MAETSVARPLVRLWSAPRYDPPYDDERPADLWPAPLAQPLLELSPPAAADTGSPGSGSAPARRPEPVPHQTTGSAADHRDGRWPPPVPATSPVTTAAAVRFVNTCLEIFNGYRSVSHFRALADPLAAGTVTVEMTHALHRLRRSTGHSPHRDALVKLRRMRTCQPRPGVAEVAVVIGTGGTGAAPEARAWALAYRLEQRHGRWLCTAARML